MPKVPGHPTGGPKWRSAVQLIDAAAQSYKQGAFVVLDGSLNVTECGADPALIFGIAAGPAGKHPEGATATTIFRAEANTKFMLPFSVAAPTKAAHENKAFGIVKDADGIWTIDTTDTVATRVWVEQVDVDTKMGLCHVLSANRQMTG